MNQHHPKAELAAAASEGVTDVAETTREVAAVLDSASPIAAEAHVHGPDCGHDHAHEHAEAPTEPPKGKYLEPAMIPELDLVASFNNNLEGPIWRKSAQELLTNIAFRAANVLEGGVKICFANNEAYKFLLAHRGFRQRFAPASPEQQKKGIVGLFDTHVIIVCDALWDQAEQLTMHKAIYFCDEVLAPVVETVIETATAETPLCEDEGCPEHPAEHVHLEGAAVEEHAHAHHGKHSHHTHHVKAEDTMNENEQLDVTSAKLS